MNRSLRVLRQILRYVAISSYICFTNECRKWVFNATYEVAAIWWKFSCIGTDDRLSLLRRERYATMWSGWVTLNLTGGGRSETNELRIRVDIKIKYMKNKGFNELWWSMLVRNVFRMRFPAINNNKRWQSRDKNFTKNQCDSFDHVQLFGTFGMWMWLLSWSSQLVFLHYVLKLLFNVHRIRKEINLNFYFILLFTLDALR